MPRVAPGREGYAAMHGLVNKAIQSFVCDTYGDDAWASIVGDAPDVPHRFEAMLSYDDPITDRVIDLVSRHLDKSRDTLLEDVGIYLVSHPDVPGPRRLLRFAGATFEEFLHSLEYLPDRVRLALPELELPPIRVRDAGRRRFTLETGELFEGYAHVLVGLVRAMSDEYGALTTFEYSGRSDDASLVKVAVHAKRFRAGRDFRLGMAVT